MQQRREHRDRRDCIDPPAVAAVGAPPKTNPNGKSAASGAAAANATLSGFSVYPRGTGWLGAKNALRIEIRAN